jgi:FAD:protein FMN transferase
VSHVYEHTFAAMGTVVSMQVIGHGSDEIEQRERREAVARAVGWFRHIGDECTRFDRNSELMRLSARVGEPVVVSALLFEAVRFALAVAQETVGAFDPTVGREMESRGYDRDYRTGETMRSDPRESESAVVASYRDVLLDPDSHTITLARPLVLDLGAVAKGLAVDLAARELDSYENFAIDAGGDLYLGGRNAAGEEWAVGIRHPREAGALLRTLRVSDAAVCTSGD